MPPQLITPHKISLLILIQRHSIIQWEEHVLSPFLFLLHKAIHEGTNEGEEPSLSSFCNNVLDRLPASSIAISAKEALLNTMAELNSPEDFLNYIDQMSDVIKEDDELEDEHVTKVDRKSVFGIFIRRMAMDFRQLSFEDSVKLYDRFMEYRRAGELAERIRNAGKKSRREAVEDDSKEMSVDQTAWARGRTPRRDVSVFLDHQIEMLERSSGLTPPPKLQRQLIRFINEVPDGAKAHFAGYLNCAQCGEYEGARDNLFRFFDYCYAEDVRREPKPERTLYQYILLNCTVLFARFNYMEEARAAITEAVEIARERKDKELLAYGLSWLCQIDLQSKTTKRNNGRSMDSSHALDTVVKRAGQFRFFNLQSLSELTKAKNALQQGLPPTKVFEPVVRSSCLNVNHALRDVAGNTHLLQSSMWDTYGISPLSALHSQLQLTFYENESCVDNVAIGYCQMAGKYLDKGNYKDAFGMLIRIKERYPYANGATKMWIQAVNETLYQMTSFRGELRISDVLASQLSAGATDDVGNADSRFRRACQDAYRGNKMEAINAIRELVDAKITSSTAADIKYLLQLIEIYMASGSPIEALPTILRCLALSEQLHSNPDYLMSLIRLAEAMFEFNLWRQALEMMEEVMPHVMVQGKLHLQSSAHLVYGMCLLAWASQGMCGNDGEEEIDGREKEMYYTSALSSFDHALTGFTKLGMRICVRRVLYIQARTYHDLGMIHERNAKAKELGKVTEELSKAARAKVYGTLQITRPQNEGMGRALLRMIG